VAVFPIYFGFLAVVVLVGLVEHRSQKRAARAELLRLHLLEKLEGLQDAYTLDKLEELQEGPS